jgi:hypothetical protein
MRTTIVIPILSAILVGGCARAEQGSQGQRPEVVATALNQLSAPGSAVAKASPPSIGSPCTAADGYQLKVTGHDVNAGSPTPIAMAPNQDFVDFYALPTGVGYCIHPGHGFPRGYYTMNCGTTSDCPAGGSCAFSRCVRPCASDSDCAGPARCLAHGPVSVCKAAPPVSSLQPAAAGVLVTAQTGTSTISPVAH